MPVLSVTRLRLRSPRFLPLFVLHTLRSARQVRAASGFLGGAILADRRLTFWTMTAWQGQDDARRYVLAGAHLAVMRHLPEWCDEASTAHWAMEGSALPSWTEADAGMRKLGRASKVRHPSPDHVTLTYRAPRPTGALPVYPASPHRVTPS